MDIMLDTHIALWALDASPKLPAAATSLLLDPANRIYVSVVSGWEVSVKHSIDAKSLSVSGGEFLDRCSEAGYIVLGLGQDHVAAYDKLDVSQANDVHKDPFDRMLLSQSRAANMLLLTHDRNLQLYGEPLVHLV